MSSTTASTRCDRSAGEPKRSSTVTSLPSPATTSVCGNAGRAVALATSAARRSGRSTTTPAGTCTNAPPARNASCRTVNASRDASDARPSSVATSSSSQVAMPQTRTPLASSAGSSSWCTTRPSRTTIMPDVLAGLGGPRTAAGRALVAGLAELARRERPVAVEVELVDAAVAPDLLGRRSATSTSASRSAAADASAASPARRAPARPRRA